MKIDYPNGAANAAPFFDFESFALRGYPFNFLLGARGIGKTYGFFKLALSSEKRFMYLRKTDPEFKNAADPEYTPVKKHAAPLVIEKSAGLAAFFDGYLDPDGKVKKTLTDDGLPIKYGYAACLTTFKNVRGAELEEQFNDGDLCMFDEFISEKSARRALKDEFDAWANFHETAFRRKKIQTFFAANSVSLGSDILAALDLIRAVEYMVDNDTDYWSDETRGILIHLPRNVRISADKAGDPLYALTAKTAFADMALQNDFANDDRHDIRRVDMRAYMPLFTCEDNGRIIFTCWQHKSADTLYFNRAKASCARVNPMLCRAAYQPLYKMALVENKLLFADYHLKLDVKGVLE